ncbi:hypothetical protein AUC45_10305 [Erythrobacter sp. YT30]|nr:hypothetical protein AUC45_10305 [Erythrobacter sp. YT30]
MALTGALCITGWLIGDWNGSERMRRLIGEHDQIGQADWEPLKRASKRGAVRSSLQHLETKRFEDQVSAKIALASAEHEQRPTPQIEREHLTRRIDAMPSLADLHAEAEAIRRSGRVWDSLETGIDYEQIDPHSAKVLTSYKNSIARLQKLEGPAHSDRLELELPRFADVAPVSPFFQSADQTGEPSLQGDTFSRETRDKALAPAD